MLVRFNPPPGWPVPPGWTPPEGWDPDPSWPPAPPGWQFWIEQPPPRPDRSRTGLIAGGAVGALLLVVALTVGIRALMDQRTGPTTGEDTPTTQESVEESGPTVPTDGGSVESTEPDDVETYTVTNPDSGLMSAEVGACTLTDYLQGDSIDELPLMACTEVHDAEIVGLFDIEGEDFPGIDGVKEAADAGCTSAFEEYVGTPAAESELTIFTIYPTEQTWNNLDDREVICIAYLSGADATESWAGSGR